MQYPWENRHSDDDSCLLTCISSPKQKVDTVNGDTYHKPAEKLPGTFQIHVGYLHEIPHHALLRSRDVLVELLRPVIELLLTLDILTGDGVELDWEGDMEGTTGQRSHKRNRWAGWEIITCDCEMTARVDPSGVRCIKVIRLNNAYK